MSYAPPPEGGSGSWGPTNPYGTMGANQQGGPSQGAPKPGSAQVPLPPQTPAPQGFPGQPTGSGTPWAGAPSDSTGSQVPPPPGGFVPAGYGAMGPAQGGYQMQPPASGAPGSGGNKGMWIAIAAVVGVLVIALGGLGIYKLATSGAAPSANSATVLGTTSMAGGRVASEFSILPGPNDENGKKTVIVIQKVTNNSSQTIRVNEYSMFVMQNEELLELSDYPSGKEPDQVDPGKWWEAVQPGQEITVAFAYTLVDSSKVEIEPFEQNNLSIDYPKYYWQPS